MQIPNLRPGEEFLARHSAADGADEKARYTFAARSLKGVYFSCSGSSEKEVRELYMRWLDRQGRQW